MSLHKDQRSLEVPGAILLRHINNMGSGVEHRGQADNAGRPQKFEICISERDQNDLKLRLRLARLPDQLNEAGWEYGTELDYLKVLLAVCTSRLRLSKHVQQACRLLELLMQALIGLHIAARSS